MPRGKLHPAIGRVTSTDHRSVEIGSIDDAIDAGIKAVDLYNIASDDLITRKHLRTFLEAAFAILKK